MPNIKSIKYPSCAEKVKRKCQRLEYRLAKVIYKSLAAICVITAIIGLVLAIKDRTPVILISSMWLAIGAFGLHFVVLDDVEKEAQRLGIVKDINAKHQEHKVSDPR